MDALINEGINSNSVLENAKNAQKQYDMYSALDTSVVSTGLPLSVEIDVEIGEKSESKHNTVLTTGSTPSNILKISNPAQAKIALDLGGLRLGQDLNNRLQVVNDGLDEIRNNIDIIASEIKPNENYSENPIVKEALGNIKNIIESSTYAGKPVFTAYDNNDELSALNISEVTELTEKKYSTIQSTIMANAENVIQNQDGIIVTKATETFLIANSNSEKVFSFPKNTPLDDINEAVKDITEDFSIHPLVYYKDNGVDNPSLVTGESKGPVQFASSLQIASIEGELFTKPLESYAPEKKEIEVEPDYSLSGMTDRLEQRRASIVSNFAGDIVLDGGKTDYISLDDDLVTRYEKINKKFGQDRRDGDGFGVTPINPGESSGSLTGGSELRESARSTNYSHNFDAKSPSKSDDVMLLPEENSTTPYITLAQREAGVASFYSGSMDQSLEKIGDDDDNFISTKPVEENISENDESIVSQESSDQLQKIIESVESISEEKSELTLEDEGMISEGLNQNENDVIKDKNGIKVNTNLDVSTQSSENAEDSPKIRKTNVSRSNESEGGSVQAERNNNGDLKQESDTSEADTKEQVESDDKIVNEFTRKGRYIGTNPVSELEDIRSVVPETLMFTLRGNLGALDYVVAAGVSIDTLSLAINTTTSFTGVTANTANGRLSLAGTSSLLESTRVTGVEGSDSTSSESSGGEFEQDRSNSNLESFSNIRNLNVQESQSPELSQINAVGLTSLQSEIDLSDLGTARGRIKNYTLSDFAQEQNFSELAQNPQLARRVVFSAYRQIDTIENNIDSIGSVNARNTYDALERVGGKILDGEANEILSSAESEQVLNNIAVSFTNTVSAEGGQGIGDRPIASLKLLSNIENTVSNPTTTTNYFANNDALIRNENYQAVKNNERVDNNYEVENLKNMKGEYSQTQSVLSQFEENLVNAQDALQELQDIFKDRVERKDNYTDLVERAENRYFENIENAKLTIREIGRNQEREDSDNEVIEKSLSSKLFAERVAEFKDIKLNESLQMAELVAAQGFYQGQLDTSQPELVNNNQNLINENSINNITGETSDIGINSGQLENNELSEFAVPTTDMDSLTTKSPVNVTSSTQESIPQSKIFEVEKYEGVVKLFEDKIGTVMVHGQGYTFKDLEGNINQMIYSEPEVVETVLEKALEDIDKISQEVADLQEQELESVGDALFAALETYGSELSANNPSVIASATRL